KRKLLLIKLSNERIQQRIYSKCYALGRYDFFRKYVCKITMDNIMQPSTFQRLLKISPSRAIFPQVWIGLFVQTLCFGFKSLFPLLALFFNNPGFLGELFNPGFDLLHAFISCFRAKHPVSKTGYQNNDLPFELLRIL